MCGAFILIGFYVKTPMEYYTVFSSSADANQQPHLLVDIDRTETISALAQRVKVLSRLPSSSFPTCPFGGIIQLGANGQVLNGKNIIQDVIPDPRTIVLFASCSYPQYLPQDESSGQLVGLDHGTPQHMIFDQPPTFDGSPSGGMTPVELTSDSVETEGSNERYEAIREASVPFVSDDSTAQTPRPEQQPSPERIARKNRRYKYRAQEVDPATYTSAMAQDVSREPLYCHRHLA